MSKLNALIQIIEDAGLLAIVIVYCGPSALRDIREIRKWWRARNKTRS